MTTIEPTYAGPYSPMPSPDLTDAERAEMAAELARLECKAEQVARAMEVASGCSYVVLANMQAELERLESDAYLAYCLVNGIGSTAGAR